MGTTICIFNQKGGVGKTTTAVNLSAAFALTGKQTMLVDCDPQGSATSISGAVPKKFSSTLKDAMMGNVSMNDIIVDSCLYHLKVIPAPSEFSLIELQQFSASENEMTLKRLLDGLEADFDFIVIDSPSSYGIFIVNAVIASDAVLIPLQGEYLAFRNLNANLKSLQDIKQTYHPDLKLAGILLTMYDTNGDTSSRIYKSARKHLGDRLLNTIIPRDNKTAESPSLGKPLVVNDLNADGAQNYLKLADELMARVQTINWKSTLNM